MESLFHALKPHATVRTVKKGGNVLFQGEIPRQVMIIRSGVVRAYTITTGGEERTVSLYGQGDVFPLSWVTGKTPNSLFYYEAVSDTRLLQVPKAVFSEALNNDPAAMWTMLDYTTNVYTGLLLRITGLEQSRAAEKIAFTLYYLLFTRGIQKQNDTYELDMRLSHSMFATLVGLTRESTAKNLKVLRDKGIIDYSGFTYTVHKSKLEGFLGEDGFRDLTL